MSRCFSIFLKILKVSLHQLNSKNNGLALLLRLSYSTETVSSRLLLPMARMETD